jgi:hypothetical protein
MRADTPNDSQGVSVAASSMLVRFESVSCTGGMFLFLFCLRFVSTEQTYRSNRLVRFRSGSGDVSDLVLKL